MTTTEQTIVSSATSFESPISPPPEGSKDFVLNAWDSIRDTALTPTDATDLIASERDRLEYVSGAELLGLLGEARYSWAVDTPTQLLTVDVMAAGRFRNAFLLPRRSTKSTALIALALGRAQHREGYRVGILTLTTGKAGRSRFQKDVEPSIMRLYPDDSTRPLKIARGAGAERIIFPNGGFVQWLSSVDDMRGEAFDLIILDEAQAAEPQKVDDVLAAALPTLITRPGAQIAVAGTGGGYRDGNLLWDWHTEAEGRLVYEADQELTVDDIETWEQTEPLVLAVHPGIGVNVSLEVVKAIYNSMTRATFLIEFLNVFPKSSSSAFLNVKQWEDAADHGKKPTPPAHFRMALSINLHGSSSSIVAAWRDDEGKACLYILSHGVGTNWVGSKARSLWTKYKIPLAYDAAVGPVQVEVEAMQKFSVKPKLELQTWPNIATAASLFTKEVDEGNIRHWDQEPLTRAVSRAGQRRYQDKRIAFSRLDDEDDITPLEAAAMALRSYDASKPKRPVKIITG